MKFRKNQRVIKVPPIGELLYVWLVGEAHIQLQVVHMEKIQELRKRQSQERAWPFMAALAQGADEIHLWPTPHKGGELKIRYYPPQKEI